MTSCGTRTTGLAERCGADAPMVLAPWRVSTMLKQNAGRIAPSQVCRELSPHETGLSQTNDPQQGARLVRAFLRITDPRVRSAVVQMVENMVCEPPRVGLL